jgi:hypothetical protein
MTCLVLFEQGKSLRYEIIKKSFRNNGFPITPVKINEDAAFLGLLF